MYYRWHPIALSLWHSLSDLSNSLAPSASSTILKISNLSVSSAMPVPWPSAWSSLFSIFCIFAHWYNSRPRWSSSTEWTTSGSLFCALREKSWFSLVIKVVFFDRYASADSKFYCCHQNRPSHPSFHYRWGKLEKWNWYLFLPVSSKWCHRKTFS